MKVGLRKLLFRLEDFLVKICLAKALFAFIFPVAVILNRFAAPRFVFNFGTLFSFQKNLKIKRASGLKEGLKPSQNFSPQIWVTAPPSRRVSSPQ